jgi:hypothetical protein
LSCTGAVTVIVDPAQLSVGHYDIQIREVGPRSTCGFEWSQSLPNVGWNKCENDTFYSWGLQEDGNVHVQLALDADIHDSTLTIEVAWNTSAASVHTVVMEYDDEVFYPNGEICGPACYTGRAKLDLTTP